MRLNVLEYLEQGALRDHPDQVAVEDHAGSRTFSELSQASRALGTYLARRLRSTNSPVAVFLAKSADIVIADLAILHSGNFYTNLDEKSPSDRLARLVENVDPAAVITTTALVDQLRSAGVAEDRLVVLDSGADDLFANTDDDLLEAQRRSVIDTDPMCLINTSGSTGVPKSVILNHRSTIDFIDWCCDTFDFSSSDVFGSLSPLYFDIYTLEIFVALRTGARVLLIPEQKAAFPASLVGFLEERKVTFIFWVPTIMVNIANLGVLDTTDLSSLRRVFFAGEVFPTKHLNVWRRALPDTQFVNLYGPIEITVDCTYFVIDRDLDDAEPIPIGNACRNTDLLVLVDGARRAEPGEIGELCVRGSSLALGYYNNDELTDAAFVQNPLNSRYPETIYRTGDLVHLNERGELMFDGRKDFQIKHQGYRIELGEIETAILALDVIRNACVLYRKESKSITLVYEADDEVTPKTLRLLLQKQLPKYMLPTEFVRTASMPRNPNGKIDRQLLSQQHAT